MRARFIAFVTRFPAPIVVLVLLVSLLAVSRLIDPATGAMKLGIDATLNGLMPVRGEAIDTFHRVRKRFGGDDVLLVAWFADDIVQVDTLKRLKQFARKVRRIEGVARVDGLATALSVRSAGDSVRVERLLKQLPRDDTTLARLREEVLSHPLYRGQFITADGRGTLTAIHFDPDLDSSGLDGAVAAIVAASAEYGQGLDQFVSGPVQARLELSRILFRDIRLALPLAVLVTAFIALAAMRNLRGVVLPLLATGIGLTLTLAVFVVSGNALNFVTAIVPPVVFVVGFAFAIHVLTEFDYVYRDQQARKSAVERVLSETFVPLSLTTLTTVIGFASLSTSSIASIRLFGIYTALGTALCWLCAVALIPALLLLLPLRPARTGSGDRLKSIARKLGQFSLDNRRAILIAGFGVALIACAAATRIEVSTDYLSNFPDDSATAMNFERIRQTFSGAVPIQIIFESDLEGAFADPIHLTTLSSFEQWLEAQPEVGAATTLIDFVGLLNRAFNATDSTVRAIPETGGEVEDLFFLGGGDELERFVDARRENTVFHVQTSAVSSGDLARLIERINEHLATLPPHIHGSVTGSSALLAQTLDDIVRGQVTSLLGAMLMIYLVLIILFGSARTGALALLPNTLPILCFFGLLGATGITLNLATSLVAAVVLGIAVDDTMHFLSRFNAEARRVANEREGINRALATVVRPVTITTIALCAGFLTLTTGELTSQVQFGALAAAALAIAWVVDLTFTPALAHRLRFVTLWEALTLDLGATPNTSIPLFYDLSNREARVAALLGSMVTFKQGEVIVRDGDEGRDIHVIIDGTARAYVTHDGEDQLLRKLERGALVGEVALFHGTRTANVEALSEVRVLRLSENCFARIAQRYPRIGAQLYKNLGKILADRLADVTSRL